MQEEKQHNIASKSFNKYGEVQLFPNDINKSEFHRGEIKRRLNLENSSIHQFRNVHLPNFYPIT
jgi:hypothetical protein